MINKEFECELWKPVKNEDILLSKATFNNYGFDKHIHEEYAIGVVSKGVMKGFFDGKNRNINNTFIMTYNPDTTHSNWSYNKGIYTQSSIYIKPSFFYEILKENFDSNEVYFNSSLFENKILACEFMMFMFDYEHNNLSSIEYECRLLEILNKILLAHCSFKNKILITKEDIIITRAKEFMEDCIDLEISLDDIVNELNISKFHFARLFKKQTHFSPYSYLMIKRLEKAKQMLQKGYNITDVTYNCGFSDQSHLSRRFKKYLGFTPKTYQNFFI